MISDEVNAEFVREIMDVCAKHPVLSQICDPRFTYLVGHSRGGKIAAITGALDPRVRGVFLIDPVDSNAYAPIGPGFPSAVTRLKELRLSAFEAAKYAATISTTPNASIRVPGDLGPLPVAVVGAGHAGDCVPLEANYNRFYAGSPGGAWELVVHDAGHFQFLDRVSTLQGAVCSVGTGEASVIRRVTQGAMVAWAQILFRRGEVAAEMGSRATRNTRNGSGGGNGRVSTSTNGAGGEKDMVWESTYWPRFRGDRMAMMEGLATAASTRLEESAARVASSNSVVGGGGRGGGPETKDNDKDKKIRWITSRIKGVPPSC